MEKFIESQQNWQEGEGKRYANWPTVLRPAHSVITKRSTIYPFISQNGARTFTAWQARGLILIKS